MPGRNTAPTFFEYGGTPPPTLPNASLTAPVANPCDPQDPITIDYDYTGAGGTGVCTLRVTAWGDDGVGVLIYQGPPAAPGTNPYPTDQFLVTSDSDDGTTGQLMIEPAPGFYWPTGVCTWSATITTDVGTEATGSDSQTIDVDAIPTPSITNQDPAPGDVISSTESITFDILNAPLFHAVWLSCADHTVVETVYDNDDFTPDFSTSTRSVITGGYRYVVRRAGGWPDDPTFYATAADNKGNVL